MVEDRIAALEERVAVLEGREFAAPSFDAWHPTPARFQPERPDSPPRADLAPPATVRSPPRPPRAPKRDLEDFLGGSVLAWLGGFAVLSGLAFLLTIAVSRGWIGEGARTALAAALSLGLLGAGVWLRERRGRTEAALAAAAVGIAGSFGTLVVAGPVYALIPESIALLGAFATGAFATRLAMRWHAQVMGWLGLLGALCAPVALGALDGGGIAFLLLAYAATAAVLVRQRWTALAAFAAAAATLQLIGWLGEAGDTASMFALVGFGVVTAALALGVEAGRRGLHRVAIGPELPRRGLHPLAAVLLVLDAALLAVAGWWILDDPVWLVAVAASSVAFGLGATRFPRISRELAFVGIAIGIVLADIAFASLASGIPLLLGWSASSLPFAALLGARARHRDDAFARFFDAVLGRPEGAAAVRADRVLAVAGLLGQMTLAAIQVLIYNARPEALAGSSAPLSALVAAGAIVVVAWACARLAGPTWRVALDTLALVAVAHFTGLALGGAVLTGVLAAQALALAALARRHEDPLSAWAAVAFAGAGLLHALTTLATPVALLDGLDAPLAAAGALAAVAAALVAVSRAPLGDRRAGPILRAAAALTVLYLASVEVVTAAGPTLTGQTLLSVLWAVAGVGALVRGLLIDDQPLRRAALALLAVTVAKVFLYDLSSLTSLYRVGSLIGLGLLLLCGGFAWQQMRPRGANAA